MWFLYVSLGLLALTVLAAPDAGAKITAGLLMVPFLITWLAIASYDGGGQTGSVASQAATSEQASLEEYPMASSPPPTEEPELVVEGTTSAYVTSFEQWGLDLGYALETLGDMLSSAYVRDDLTDGGEVYRSSIFQLTAEIRNCSPGLAALGAPPAELADAVASYTTFCAHLEASADLLDAGLTEGSASAVATAEESMASAHALLESKLQDG
jgi:hypothetical protein